MGTPRTAAVRPVMSDVPVTELRVVPPEEALLARRAFGLAFVMAFAWWLAGCAAPPPAPEPRAPDLEDPAAEARAAARDAMAQLELLTEGASALSAGDPETAADLLGAYLAFDPGNGMALFLRGVALLDLGRRVEARDALVASTVAEPDDPSGYAVLARIEFELGDRDAAIAALESATRVAPDEAQHWTSLGLLYYDADRWGDAYEAFLTAVDKDPADAGAHRALGRLYVTVGEPDLAERAFRTSLSLDPEDNGLRVALGHVLRDLGRPEDAVEVYREAARREPDNPWLHANTASSLVELGRPHEARPCFEEALALLEGGGMDGALVHLNYGTMLEGLGDLDGAEFAYERAVELGPSLAAAHESLGMLRLHLGDVDAAREHLVLAEQLGPVHADTLLELVLLLEGDEAWDAATACARRLLAETTGDPRDSLRRARLLLESRNPEVHDAAAAVELLLPLVQGAFQDHPASWELLSEAYQSQGELEEALGALDGALAASRPESAVHERFAQQRARLVSRLETEP